MIYTCIVNCFATDVIRQYNKDRRVISTNGAGIWGRLYLKMNLNSIITADTKINSKWIPDLNVKPKTIQLTGETGENVCDLGWGKGFLDKTPKAHSIKAEIDKLHQKWELLLFTRHLRERKAKSYTGKKNICKSSQRVDIEDTERALTTQGWEKKNNLIFFNGQKIWLKKNK